MDRRQHLLAQAKLLIERLERISVDSIWSRRASGHRGALLKWAELLEFGDKQNDGPQAVTPNDLDRLQSLVEASFILLEKAAKERLR
jgi:hypothetical protein